FNVFAERPLVVEAFNEDARRLGVCMYGHTDDERLNWRYGAFLLQSVTLNGQYVGDSSQGSINGRLAGSPWYDECSGGRGYFHWAVSGMAAKPDGDRTYPDTNGNAARFRTRPEARSTNRWVDTSAIAGADWYEILGFESIINVGPLQVVGEYQRTWLQRDNSVAVNSDLDFQGAYCYVSYFLTGEHMPYDRKSGTLGRVHPFENFFLVPTCDGCRGTGWGAWQVAARYSYLDLSDGNVQGGEEQNVTVGLNWYWTAYSKVQFNAIYGKIDDHRVVAPNPGFTGGDFWILGTRFMADF
ncbi:MAG: ATPase, partial [Planctomycetales bacterium]|nr:ATPase [Planctomycetales bacterium]